MFNYRQSLPHLPPCLLSPTKYNPCEADCPPIWSRRWKIQQVWYVTTVSRSDMEQLRVAHQKAKQNKKKRTMGYLWRGYSKLCLNQFFVPSNTNLCVSFSVCFLYLTVWGRTKSVWYFPLLYVLFFLGKRCSHISFDWKLYTPNQLNEVFLISYFLRSRILK